jgi:cellulose synthase (UDP-forming)
LVPYLIANTLLFRFVGWGIPTWRGQQFSLALFPIWIKAVTSAIGSVYFGRTLGFVVTPKTRQGQARIPFELVRPQLIAMVVLALGVIWGLGKIAFGATEDQVSILINVAWAIYDLIMLSVVLGALTYRADPNAATPSPHAAAAMHRGRAAAGGLR